ncbi:MAG: hypothetical protein WDW38_007301 [Sanguina aurantia]
MATSQQQQQQQQQQQHWTALAAPATEVLPGPASHGVSPTPQPSHASTPPPPLTRPTHPTPPTSKHHPRQGLEPLHPARAPEPQSHTLPNPVPTNHTAPTPPPPTGLPDPETQPGSTPHVTPCAQHTPVEGPSPSSRHQTAVPEPTDIPHRGVTDSLQSRGWHLEKPIHAKPLPAQQPSSAYPDTVKQ